MSPSKPINVISDWLTPSQAVELLSDAFTNVHNGRSVAKSTLLGRLRGGVVQAVSTYSLIGGRREYEEQSYLIPKEHWLKIDEADLVWASGDFEYRFIDEESAWRSTAITRHYGVKFDPPSVSDIIKSAKGNSAVVKQDQELAEKGLPVSSANLKAWYDFYKAVTKEPDDTEDYAWAHAKRCFPNNTVSRESVRELRGSRKRGPKKKSDSAE